MVGGAPSEHGFQRQVVRRTEAEVRAIEDVPDVRRNRQ